MDNQKDFKVTCEIDGVVYKGKNSVYFNGETKQVFIDGKIVGIDCDENGDDLRWKHSVEPIPQVCLTRESRWAHFWNFFAGKEK